jgi:Domain of unknown function (DUF1840)
MLIEFQSPAYATITMLERLQGALKSPPNFVSARDHQEVEGQAVNFANRAYPLVQLLTAAANKNKHVIWDSAK